MTYTYSSLDKFDRSWDTVDFLAILLTAFGILLTTFGILLTSLLWYAADFFGILLIIDEKEYATSTRTTLRKLIVGGCNKWKWVEKVVAEKIYFQNREKEGDKKCLKTFILMKCRNQ